MDQIDALRFLTMAATYDRMCPAMVPHYDDFQDEALQLAGLEAAAAPVVVDLGAGSGRFLEKVLQRYPSARAYWVDASADFLQVARRRLAPYAGRVQFVTSALEEDWESQAPAPVQFIFSMSAIHHLETEEKRRLYARCFKQLAPGGWFCNVDEMQTVYPDAYLTSLRFWWRYVGDQASRFTGAGQADYEQWLQHFAQWKLRNLDGWQQPKRKGDDLHEAFLAQLTWLHEAGFVNVDLFFKYHLWSAIGGQKPG